LFSKNVGLQEKQGIKQIFQVPDMDNNTIHLGHPLILPAKDRSVAYNFIYDRFRSKLNAYQANPMSHAARLALIKSVFAFIPVYYMSNILFPKKFLSKFTAIIRSFWLKFKFDREEPPLVVVPSNMISYLGTLLAGSQKERAISPMHAHTKCIRSAQVFLSSSNYFTFNFFKIWIFSYSEHF
jgi:hypothetical protein